jgi:diacylglycerol kinase (ATP)
MEKPHNADSLKSRGGPARILKAFQYSMQGLNHAFRYEAAFRQELLLAVPALIAVWFFPISAVERVVLIATVILVLIVELLNSAIEAVVDRISNELHPLSGRAKDLGSAAVLFALALMTLSWGLILWPTLAAMW